MILRAKYLVCVEGPVIENGAMAVEDGRIAAIGPADAFPHQGALDYGHAVIGPGFVNAHTHLELSALAGRVRPSHDFVDWLRWLVGMLGSDVAERDQVHAAVRAGIAELLRNGVTMVGDITRKPSWAREALSASLLCGVSFGEVLAIGSRRHLLAERLEAAAERGWERERLRTGISPHAPYTVEPDGMLTCAKRAATFGAPVCMHLAETREEEEFTRQGSGPLADLMREFGVWDDRIPSSGCSPVELAHRTELLGPRTVIAHANYVSDADIELTAACGASVAFCPRTHRAFGHSPHRFRNMLAAGVNVCIGTDSLASAPSLSVLEELRFLRHENPDMPPEELLAMGTLHGARALGLPDEAGSLVVGKSADLAVIPLGNASPGSGWVSILDSDLPVGDVYLAGELQRPEPA